MSWPHQPGPTFVPCGNPLLIQTYKEVNGRASGEGSNRRRVTFLPKWGGPEDIYLPRWSAPGSSSGAWGRSRLSCGKQSLLMPYADEQVFPFKGAIFRAPVEPCAALTRCMKTVPPGP